MVFTPHTKEDLKNFGVYCFINIENGRFYIGSTIESFKSRKQSHINALRRNDHHSVTFQRSWNKHGEDAFQFHILNILNKNKKEIRAKEQSYLDTLQPYNPSIGFNRSKSASVNDIPVDKTRMRKLIGRPIIAYNLDGSFYKQFDSVVEAVELLKIDHSGIISNCKNRTARYKRWMFKYFDGQIYSDQIEPYKLSLIGKKRIGVGEKIVATRRKKNSYGHSEEQKEKFRQLKLGTKSSQETRDKQSISAKNKIRSEQHKINNGIANKKHAWPNDVR